MEALAYTLHGDRERRLAVNAIWAAEPLWRVEVREPKRSDAQNDKMWAMISDIMRWNPDWFGPGLDKYDIKHVFVAGLHRDLRVAKNVDGDGLTPLPIRTSKFGVRKMADLLTYIQAWGDQHGIVWTEPT